MVKKYNELPALIRGPVGQVGKSQNLQADVMCIQYLFNLTKSVVRKPYPEDGICTPDLVNSIRQFQIIQLRYKHADGVIDPVGRTFSSLVELAVTMPRRPATAQPPQWPGMPPVGARDSNQLHQLVDNYLLKVKHIANAAAMNRRTLLAPGLTGSLSLTEQDYLNATATLGNLVETNIIKAFATVESGGRSGFGGASLPIIAYEGHIFRRYSKRKYDQTHPLLSYAYKKKAGPEWQKNNKDQTTAWDTLAQAYELDASAALMACSWGMFQIMGFNFKSCGNNDVFAFVNAMKGSAGNHLDAFLKLCKSNGTLFHAMQSKNYAGMASTYNGQDYGDYDRRIKNAYEALTGKKK